MWQMGAVKTSYEHDVSTARSELWVYVPDSSQVTWQFISNNASKPITKTRFEPLNKQQPNIVNPRINPDGTWTSIARLVPGQVVHETYNFYFTVDGKEYHWDPQVRIQDW